MRRAQAMIESMLAVIFVTFVLLFSIYIARMLTAKILMDHAAARAARARAVGLNDFMCAKSAHVAMLPVSGQRLIPMSDAEEFHRIPLYLESKSAGRALAILNYEWWKGSYIGINESHGISPSIDVNTRITTDSFSVGGSASIESHYPLYMNQF